ncbi:MAG TPA: ATP-binding cassette domain-containing protein [Pseudonocardiaceae bacterium]
MFDVQATTTISAATPTAGIPDRVTLEDIRFQYDDKGPVIDGLSLRIAVGETVGIVGPSGCGKSTLLALVAGLQQPTSGLVTKNVEDGTRLPLSMVFQKDTLLPWLSVRNNVLFFSRLGRNRKRRSGALDDRVAELLKLGGLEDYGEAFPYQLSGGMRRRVAFLAAVAPDPQILLLDEPFSSVDEPTRIGIHQDVFRVTRMMATSTILVTHDLAEAITLCDRVLIMSRRPSTVAKEHTMPFGDEREMLAIRETDQYSVLYKSLWHDLGAQIGGAAAPSAAPED